MRDILRGNKISSYDGDIIAGVASLIPRNQSRPIVKGARDIRAEDLDTNGNLIFLGSPKVQPVDIDVRSSARFTPSCLTSTQQ